MWRQLRICLLTMGLVLAGPMAGSAAAQTLGPLVEISRPSAVGGCDTGFNAFGTWPVAEAVEPIVAVNPTRPNHFVAAWIQGSFQDIITAVSFDGGQNWQRTPIPLTVCSGGSFPGGGDPWLSFAPNGDLYAVALAGNSPSPLSVMVTKSVDGSMPWSTPIVIPGSDSADLNPDQPRVTPDPTDARFAYAFWTGHLKHANAAVFSRTTDGGLTWEPARSIFQTGSQTFLFANQILVLPDGTLVDMFEYLEQQPNKPITFTSLRLLRSTDKGQTWSGPLDAVTMTPLYTSDNSGLTLIVDPKTGQQVFDSTFPSFAVDPRNGNLYSVWEDGRFSGFQYNDIAFSMSSDGGSTWSIPIRVNQTPLNIPPLNRQSFMPWVAVAANGTIAVSYYDFRFNNSTPGLPTDRWLVQCNPSSNHLATDPASWGSEVRLTSTSFNIEAVVPALLGGRFFLGDYFGMDRSGNNFVTTFTAVDNDKVTSIFARTVGGTLTLTGR